jgi:hypothetical protein
MKAKIKETGEIVEVKQKGTVHISSPAYHTTDNRIIPSFALEFEKNIDWEQRRYEIAKEVFASIYDIFQNEHLEKVSVHAADALIAELKKVGEQ